MHVLAFARTDDPVKAIATHARDPQLALVAGGTDLLGQIKNRAVLPECLLVSRWLGSTHFRTGISGPAGSPTGAKWRRMGENGYVGTGTVRNPDSRQRLTRYPRFRLGSDDRQLQPGAIRRMSADFSRKHTLIGPPQTDGADSVRADKQRRASWK
jgi:hypothetical protein